MQRDRWVIVCQLPWLCVLAWLALLPGCYGADPEAPAGSQGASAKAPLQPRVVVIVIDTLRPDHLELHGYARSTAPFLTSLANRSSVFRNAHSTSSWTAPSTASLFTGAYPLRHGVTQGFMAQRKASEQKGAGAESSMQLRGISASIQTLPEMMRGLGYRTFGFAANINIGSELGFDRGFDFFARAEGASAEELAERVLEHRDALQAGRRSFLYLHFNDPHTPYHARLPWYEAGEGELADTVARYDSEIRFLDEVLARLHDELDWARDSVLLVTSDHGEEFMERGRIGHHFSLHGEVNRVLLMLGGSHPALRAGRIDTPVSLIDLLPTLGDLLGAEPLPGRDGTSLLPLLAPDTNGSSNDDFEKRAIFAHRSWRRNQYGLWAIIQGRWKLIENDAIGSRQLFDLAEDPLENRNLLTRHPNLARLLIARLAAFREEFAETGLPVEVPLDESLRERLRELGYILEDGEASP